MTVELNFVQENSIWSISFCWFHSSYPATFQWGFAAVESYSATHRNSIRIENWTSIGNPLEIHFILDLAIQVGNETWGPQHNLGSLNVCVFCPCLLHLNIEPYICYRQWQDNANVNFPHWQNAPKLPSELTAEQIAWMSAHSQVPHFFHKNRMPMCIRIRHTGIPYCGHSSAQTHLASFALCVAAKHTMFAPRHRQFSAPLSLPLRLPLLSAPHNLYY